MPRTCAGQGHPPVFLLVRGALVGACGRYGKGRSCRQGASVVVQLAAGGHNDPIIVGEERELWRGRSHAQPLLSRPLGCAETRGPEGGPAVLLAGSVTCPCSPPTGWPLEGKLLPPPASEEKLRPPLPSAVPAAGHLLGQLGTGRLEDSHLLPLAVRAEGTRHL